MSKARVSIDSAQELSPAPRSATHPRRFQPKGLPSGVFGCSGLSDQGAAQSCQRYGARSAGVKQARAAYEEIRGLGKAAGVVLNPHTSEESIRQWRDHARAADQREGGATDRALGARGGRGRGDAAVR